MPPAADRAPDALARAPRLVLRFALYAGVAVLVTVGVAFLIARVNARSSAQDDVREDASYVADELARDDLAGVAFAGPVSEDIQAQLDDFLGRIASARDLARVSLVGPDGRVSYSTDHALIGRRLAGADLDRARAAFAGGRASGTSRLEGPRVLESYVPVRWLLSRGQRPTGVLGAYRSYETVASQIRNDVLTQTGVILLALLGLYGAMMPILRRVTATLEARNRSLIAQTELLRTSEARYRALTEQASDAIIVADQSGRLLEANPKACEMLGYTRTELLGLHSMDLMSVADVGQLPLHFEELRAGKTLLMERPVRRKDGTFIVGDVSAKMLEDGRLHASIRDVTERKRLEDELRDAQKLEAVGRLAAGVAEDFDGLLGKIRAHADSLATGANGDALVRTEADEIRRATDWGSTLTRQLLAVGRRQTLNPTVVDVNALLHERRQLLRSMLGERIELELEAGSDLDQVRADPSQLEQVVLDLALSARDAMPHGGTLTVTTANVEFDRREDAVHGTGGRHVMLAIADTGDRDSHSAGARMFEPYGDDEAGERRGLGLAAVYGIVHQSGGSIGVESEPGRGTTVRVYLPSAQVAETTRS